MNYYNEWDPQAAAWLRELIENKLIPEGVVDERSITEVQAKDLKGFTQCHFFAGIAGWPLALQIAGIPSTKSLWTGSPPCQPFSVAGSGKGKDDPRHLAPTFLNLIADCRPTLLFGEQVAAAVTKDFWIDSLLFELEEEGYSSGFTVLPACSVGAPHKRDRLFFGANRLAHTCGVDDNKRHRNAQYRRQNETEQDGLGGGANELAYAVRKQRNRRGGVGEGRRVEPTDGSGVFQLGDSDGKGPQIRRGESGEQLNQEGRETAKRPGGLSGVSDRVAHCEGIGRNEQRPIAGRGGERGREKKLEQRFRSGGVLHGLDTTNTHHGGWSDADWLGCRDGKFRPVEPGTFPLANGVPARVGRLRGYGNAIVPQVAAEFIKAFMAAKAEAGV